MAEPKIGSAALTITIDKAQVAAEAKAAITPAIANAGQEASQALTASTAGGAGIQQMITQQKQLATEARQAVNATTQAISDEAGAVEQAGAAAAGAGSRLQGLGSAATATGRAIGGTAGQVSLLGTALGGPGGLAAGAAVGVVELIKLSQSMNDTELSARHLSELAGKAGQDAAAALVAAQPGAVATRLGFSDLNAQLKELANQGPAGIGTLLNMRDAMLAAGKDTSAIDTTLEQFNATFDTTADTVARGTDYLKTLTGAENDAAEAAKRLEAATNNQASAASSLLTSQGSVVSAENRVRQAKEALANFGTDATAKSIREQRDEAAAVEDASQRIIDAQQHIIDARQKVADAQAALADAGVHEQLAVADAQDAVDAAQRKLNASSPEERGPAQHALDDANQRLTDAKKALDRAKPDAERALADAVRGVQDAMRSEADAHRQLADAQDRQRESNDKAASSAGDYQAAVDDVTAAQLALVQATVDQKIRNEELQSGIKTGPVEALGILRQALRDLAADLDPSSELAQRIAYLLASMSPEGARQVLQIAGGGSTPGQVARRAAGGDVWGGMKFRAAELGPELLVRDGIYEAPPGRSTVIPAGQTAAMLSGGPREIHHHTHSYSIVVQSIAEPAERAIRRELERFASMPAR